MDGDVYAHPVAERVRHDALWEADGHLFVLFVQDKTPLAGLLAKLDRALPELTLDTQALAFELGRLANNLVHQLRVHKRISSVTADEQKHNSTPEQNECDTHLHPRGRAFVGYCLVHALNYGARAPAWPAGTPKPGQLRLDEKRDNQGVNRQ